MEVKTKSIQSKSAVENNRIAVVVSNPIQHFCPQYASIARLAKVKVFFASMLGYKPYHDKQFGKTVSWAGLELDKFDHEFLNDEVLQTDASLDAPVEQALEKFQPDIVIVYGYFQKFQRRAYRWAVKNKVRIVYISDTERRQHRTKLKELIKYPILKYYFSKVDTALTVGDANEQYYGYVGVKNLIRMHFPINVDLYRKSYRTRSGIGSIIRSDYDIKATELTLLVVGKLIPKKRTGHIIEAMRLLENEVMIHLLIVGSGEMEDKLKQQAKTLKRSKVHFAGFQTPDDLPAYYAAADIYIHPASADPHPLAVSEAIYMGCPVIVSDLIGSHGPNDDVQEGKNGFVYPCGNVQALAEKIKQIIADPENARLMAFHSHAIAESFQERAHGGFLEDLIGLKINRPEQVPQPAEGVRL